MQLEFTPCRRCASLEQQVEALKTKIKRLQSSLSTAQSKLAASDRPRACREIKRREGYNQRFGRHWCGASLHREIRQALKQEPCRLMPEIGVGTIVLYRCEYLRLARCIDKTETCWPWAGHIGAYGYGVFNWDDQRWPAHRFVYTLFVAPIGYGLVIDHTCRNKACVNPEHLEVVTQGENIRRHHGIQVSTTTA